MVDKPKGREIEPPPDFSDCKDEESIRNKYADYMARIFGKDADEVKESLAEVLGKHQNSGDKLEAALSSFVARLMLPECQKLREELRKNASTHKELAVGALELDVQVKELARRLGQLPAIDIDTIEVIHGIERHQDGFISFCRHVNEGHEDLAGVRVGELRQWLPRLVDWLLVDSYFTVNASDRVSHWKNRVTGCPHPYRKSDAIRYLNALYVDCDIYQGNPPLAWPDAASKILAAQDGKVIPYYSVMVRSGRGMYLLWLLKTERPGAYARALPQEISLYKTLSEKFHDVLNSYEPRLVADRTQQGRLLGLLRVPGSQHGKAGVPVIANMQVVQGVGVPVYTLAELAGFFDVPVTPRLPNSQRGLYLSGSGKPVKRPGSCPARRRGRIASAEKRLQDLFGIAQHRGGIEQGKRYVSVLYLVEFCKAAGHTMSDTLALAERFAGKCKPPYPTPGDSSDVPVSEIVKSVWVSAVRIRKLKSASIAKFFDVTPELAEELELASIIPDATRQARASVPGPRARARGIRMDIIRSMVAEHPGRVPTVRQVKARLQGVGSGGSLGIISRDIRAVLSEFHAEQQKRKKSQ